MCAKGGSDNLIPLFGQYTKKFQKQFSASITFFEISARVGGEMGVI